MDEAFLAILENKDFEYITVKEICEHAGVNRSTFYLHYENIGDLLDECGEYINRRFASYFDDISFDIKSLDSLPKEELYLITPQYLKPWLLFIKENRRLFLTIIKRSETLFVFDNLLHIFDLVIDPILARFNIDPEDRKYILAFYVEGIVAIVKKWLREGCQRDIDDIIKLISDCVQTYENI